MARAAAAFALVALVMCVALGTAMAEQKATWTDCTGPGAIGKIDNISINPNPLKIHGNTSIIGTGSITEAITTGATYTCSMYYLGIRVVENKGSLCKSAKVPIPLGIGYVYVEGLDCPVGPYVIQLATTNGDGKEIMCVKMEFSE